MPGFIVSIVVAVVIGWIATSFMRGNIPGGFWGASLAGLLGAWIGAYLPVFNRMGPIVGGIAIVPTLIGSAIAVFLLGLFKGVAVQTK